MNSPLNHRVMLPLPEIQVAEDRASSLERSDSIPLHAFPLPLPFDHREKACGEEGGDDEIEPTLYKKVIYIPDTSEASNKGKQPMNDSKEVPPSSKTFPGEISEEQKHEHVENIRNSNRGKACYKRYLKHGTEKCLSSYKREWTHCFELGVIVASHYLLWENIVWGILMGAWLQQQTRGKLGSVEVFSSNLLCGTAFVLLGGQALLVVGVSAPAVIFIISISSAANRLLIDFLPWMGWVGIWSSAVLIILAVSGACRCMPTTITSFTWEAIQIFTSMSFIWNAMEEIVHLFTKNIKLDTSMLSLWLATSSFVVSTFLSRTGSLKFLNKKLCRAVGNCALPITLLLFTGVTYLPKLDRLQLQRVTFPPTGFRTDGVTELGSLVRLKSVPLWGIFLAVIPGLLLASMIFVDHSAASILLQNEISSDSRKSRSRSWDICIVALLVLVCGIFGLPFCYGLFFQSLKHAQVLTHDKSIDLESQESQSEIKVQRISGLIASLLSGLALVPGLSWLTAKIPLAVVIGLFLEVAMEALSNLHFMKNTRLLLTDPYICSVNGSTHSTSIPAIRIYTAIQFTCALIIFAASRSPAAILFPLFILLMIWMRHWPLHTLFIKKGLNKIDRKLFNNQPTPIKITKLRLRKHSSIEVMNSHNKDKRKAIMQEDIQASDQSLPQWKDLPVLPTTTKRRLRERKIRRNKRLRRTTTSSLNRRSLENHEEDHVHRVVLPLPCRYQLKRPDITNYDGIEGGGGGSSSSFVFSASKPKSLVRQLSPQLILNKRKKNSAIQNPVEMHSNILYDPHPLPNPNDGTSLGLTIDNDNEVVVDGQGIRPYISRPPSSSSFASPSPSQTHNDNRNHNAHINNDIDGVHGTSTFPRLTKEDVFPVNRRSALVEGRIQSKKYSITNGVESSKRSRMILNQGRWPSNKPMPTSN
ncbi:hypothetical protein SUGI_0974280 [Cryptomeria japonica]|uniref:uncharacterized protein LOC131073919 n=1 Tax=Cryptomeria japonica TaxID=3369 RepID=UPI002414C9DA|nr:uncharacterized protein LOC131073919 [Cryptomeria japonica]GLJ46241.1 hypothetical protein SUGI_0974280 [Cryptomeria japonica]